MLPWVHLSVLSTASVLHGSGSDWWGGVPDFISPHGFRVDGI